MMGIKERAFETHHSICLDALIPQDNFYRELQDKIELEFVRELVAHFYKPYGRSSIDPVVFFKLQLIMFFEDIRSERQLMQTVAMRLDHRWYIGYDLIENVPDHSSLSKIRDRYGVAIFERFFEKIVEMCIAAGLVWGEEVHFDGSTVVGNADPEQQVPRFYWNAVQEHLNHQFPQQSDLSNDQSIPPLIAKYDGQTQVTKRNSYRKKADRWISLTDTDATPLEHQKAIGYRLHYGVDGGKARIILACLATPAVIHDVSPMLDLTWKIRFRWQQNIKRVVTDSRYGSGEILAYLEWQGITPFIPPLRNESAKRSSPVYPKSRFHYDEENDVYICPQNHILPYYYTSGDYRRYRANREDCQTCPVLAECTKTGDRRTVTHSIYKQSIDRVSALKETELFKKLMRKRQVWVEPKFGEVKQWHHGRRYRLRGHLKVNCDALIKASGQNIKQLLKTHYQSSPILPPSAPVSIIFDYAKLNLRSNINILYTKCN